MITVCGHLPTIAAPMPKAAMLKAVASPPVNTNSESKLMTDPRFAHLAAGAAAVTDQRIKNVGEFE